MAGLNWFSCLVYLDDIAVFSQTFEEHVNHLKQVMNRMTQASLKFNPEKTSLFQRKINFLGFEVSGNGIESDRRKVEAILG